MIEFKYIEWKNFLSTGNNPTRFEFDRDITLILGENGSGKTTILDALVFALYGVSYRGVNKGQLINNRNKKGLLVEVAFAIDGHEYIVRRGQKPNIFEIIKDGKKVDQLHSVKEMQSYLEDILQMSVKTFKQIVILGSTNYIPFMQLTAPQRREIVENILDMGVFTKMRELIKTDIADLDKKLNNLHMEKVSCESMSNAFGYAVDERIEELQREEAQLIEEVKAIRDVKFDTKIDLHKEPDIIRASQSIIREIGALEGQLNSKKSSIERIKGLDVCPTCYQKVTEDHKDNIINGMMENIDEIQSKLEDMYVKREKVEKALGVIDEAKKRIQDLKNRAMRLRDRIEYIRKEIQKCNKRIEEQKSDDNVFTKQLEEIESNIQQTSVILERYKKALSYLKDDGLRAIMVRKYLPHINHFINHYLAGLGLPVKFSLDETFQEKIETPIYDNYSYESFSEGEKVRINLAILFAWRAIAKMRNSVSCNILIFDEILDGSTDEDGIHAFFRLIKEIINEERLKVVVISHTQGAYESKFERIILCQKNRGFSTMKTVT